MEGERMARHRTCCCLVSGVGAVYYAIYKTVGIDGTKRL